MWRRIFAITVGFVVIGVLVAGTDQLFAFAIDGFDQMATKPFYYYVISIVTSAAYAIVGGWTCASLSKSAVPRQAKIFMGLGEAAGIAAAAASWRTVPHYYPIALLVLFPAAVQFGASSFEWTRPVEGTDLETAEGDA